MNRESMIDSAGKPFLRPLLLAIGLCMLAIVATPFIGIWIGWGLAWKIGLTAVLGVLFTGILHHFVRIIVAKAVDEIIQENKGTKPKSKFMQRLEENFEELKKEWRENNDN